MKNGISKFILPVLFSLVACTTTKLQQPSTGAQQNFLTDAKIFTAAYQQRSAEYKALCYQAYNIARLQLDQFLKISTPKPMAIMTDIDETVLDNSPYQVHQALQGKDYDPVSWHDWTDRAAADTVPGSLAFLRYAASKNVEVFYVTNRDEAERRSTLQNLQKFGFPDADNEHLLLMPEGASSKVPRREQIQKNYTLIMQLGDNLNDFSGAFEKGTVEQRSETADQLQQEFGKSMIVLPNPSYGEWENALYNYHFNLTPAQKDSLLRKALKNY